MLDKVKALGIDAVEMTAGGWGARKHCDTAKLLADPAKLEAFKGELEKRGMRIAALNTSCNPLWPSETGEEMCIRARDFISGLLFGISLGEILVGIFVIIRNLVQRNAG